jgi:hypothetical protein
VVRVVADADADDAEPGTWQKQKGGMSANFGGGESAERLESGMAPTPQEHGRASAGGVRIYTALPVVIPVAPGGSSAPTQTPRSKPRAQNPALWR